jgi:choline/glycine/proline betaine transport protein
MSTSPLPSSGAVRMNPPVFYFSAAFILLFGLVVIAMPQQAGAWLLAA